MADYEAPDEIETEDEEAKIPPLAVKITKKQIKTWKSRIEKGLQKQKTRHETWEAALECYAPKPGDAHDDKRLMIRTNRVYEIVERKIPDLFYQRADVSVSPSPLLVGKETVCKTHSDILNEYLGLDGVNAKRVMRKGLFDWELFGAGWSKLGFEVWTSETVDQMTGMTVPVPVKKECYWDDVSPKRVIIPAEMTTTEFDKHAPWLALKFEMPVKEARRRWGLRIPKDFKGGKSSSTKDELKFTFDESGDGGYDGKVCGTEIWYRSHLERKDRFHPDHLTKLVMLDGVDEPVEHADSPDQTIDGRGQLTPNSLIGYPLCANIIRTMTDSSYVVADVAIAKPLVDELDTFREQMVRMRDLNLLKWTFNNDTTPNALLEKAMGAPLGGAIGLPGESFSEGNPLRQMEMGQYSPDNYQTQDRIDNDLARTFGIDGNASGVTSGGSITATEAGINNTNRNVRLAYEQGIVADFYIACVTKLSTLVMRYLGPEDVAAIVGPQKAQEWAQFKAAVPTRLAFTMEPDSSLRNDTPIERKQMMDMYSFFANEPMLQQAKGPWLKSMMLRLRQDPAYVQPPPPPQPQTEPPKINFSIAGKDFAEPQAPMVADILQKSSGIKVDPNAFIQAVLAGQQQAEAEAAAKAQGSTENPGSAAKAEPIQKHPVEMTGMMNATGQPAGGAMSPNTGQPTM